MDAKITRQRMGRMLSYDWLKIIGLVVAVIFGWMLIFTMTGTPVLPSQQFTIFSYYCNDPLTDTYLVREASMVRNKVFSHEVLEVKTYELSQQPDMYHRLLQTRFSTNEGDLFIVPKEKDLSVFVGEGEDKTYPLTYVETLLSDYPLQFFELETYFKNMSTWLDGWYDGGHQSGTLNEEKIKTEFIAKVTKNKDKRYKTNKEKQAGAIQEVERVRKYKNAYDVVQKAIADGTVTLERLQSRNPDGSLKVGETTGKPLCDGVYAINLCPNEPTSKMKDWYEYDPSTEEGKPAPSARNMCAMFLDMYKVDDAYEYESLVYVAYMITDCYDLTNA